MAWGGVVHRRYFIKAEGCLADEFGCPAGQCHGMGDQLLDAELLQSLQMVEEGYFSWVLKTLSIWKTCSSPGEGHCPVPWVFTFCPDMQLNTDSTLGAMSCFLCYLSKVSGCTLCQEQGQTCVTSLLTETNSALGPTYSAGAVLSPQGVGDRTGFWLWCGVGVMPLPPQYPSPVFTVLQEVLWAQPAALQAVQAVQPKHPHSV